ncbi:MAG TPA: hypothetical protein VFB65_13560 [Pyrinomonadaceae bacterium]|nr:hypothetical protein [Pyrinomonadaceae bacterium]
MQDVVDLKLGARWRAVQEPRVRLDVFVVVLVACAVASAVLASWLPLQVSIVTVFLFAGPHNWFELRYFLMRLPVRFGRSRNFFITAFTGLGFLTLTYISLPLLYRTASLTEETWLTIVAGWNTLLLFWLALLTRLRSRQKRLSDWSWTVPVALTLAALNWLRPDLFSLAIVYIHPLVAFWFLDRHLQRTRPDWLRAYRRCLLLLPLLLGAMVWQLSRTAQLPDDNGLFWRITQHSGAELLPRVSSHLLVSVHLFLEMLHYAVWIVALPLIGASVKFWDVKKVPLARHPKGFPKLIAAMLIVAIAIVVALWLGFSTDYATTRDVYFTIAIAHVLAEAPFLLRML